MLKFGRYLLLGLIVSTLWVSQSKSMGIFFTKTPTPLSFIQANQLGLAKKITQTRTGNIAIEVVNSKQQPIPGVEVKIEQVTHEFEFGTALSTNLFAQGANPTDRERYLHLARQLFNATVHENALKWDAMEPQRGQLSYADADRILGWSEAHSLPLRGHTLFWEVEQWRPAICYRASGNSNLRTVPRANSGI
jgi:endo-1,4-beta-xylanase